MMNYLSLSRSSWAWYQASIAEFRGAESDAIIGRLASASNFNVDTAQVDAWQIEIAYLKDWLAGLVGEILLEFTIPRMGSRIDAVVLIGPIIFAIEFKAHAKEFDRSAVEQVWDYALDLKNFHEASHLASIIPILVATDAATSAQIDSNFADDGVCRPLCIHPGDVRAALEALIDLVTGDCIDVARWAISRYRPTPTIIEAARALYANHSVHDIARHDAGALNLRVTSQRVEELIEDAKQTSRKLICFVTGVPGAGKTLVGLNVATQRRDETQPTHAVFLSGNGPLVAVLREALVRDEVKRRRQAGERTTKGRVSNPVKAFIQNVHHFRDAALQDSGPPIDHVVIFDEAQRAWTREKTAKFMKQKKGQPNFLYSEPAFLMSYLDRHPDWAVVVCLVGGGQEIHTGEAGIGEWLQACNEHFRHWSVYISSNLTDTEYAAGHALDEVRPRQNAYFEDSLHLSVSMRSFRAENVSSFVKAVLDCDREAAIVQLKEMKGRFPVVLTRDLRKAKSWIRRHARGSERFGLVASSKAMRLKPHAIDIRVAVDPVQWFLNDRDDTRSSYYLEDCATEFQVQGLELDWTCVNWDGDLRYVTGGWSCHDFRGNRWQNVKKSDRQNYLRNAYRVLLTRARQGMVVFIPPGDPDDHTRLPKFYNSTFDYLAELGIPVLQ
jgi:hypothetical protein